MSLTSDIKNFALDLGYSKAGITTADAFSEHVAEVESRGNMYDFYLRDPRRLLQNSSPRELYPWARSIIVLVWDYMQKQFQARCCRPAGPGPVPALPTLAAITSPLPKTAVRLSLLIP